MNTRRVVPAPREGTARPGEAPPIEAKAPSRNPAVDALFVSPRVVDEDAFLAFAGSLREATSVAMTERETLKAAIVEVKRLSTTLDADWGPGGTRVKRLAAITQALQGVESRLNRVDEALAKLEGFATTIDRAERAAETLTGLIERAVAERAEFEARATAQAEDRLRDLDAFIAERARAMEHAAADRMLALEREAERRAAEVQGRLQLELAKATSAAAQLAESEAARAAATLARSVERAEAIAPLLDARTSDLQAKADGAAQRIALAAETAMHRLAEHLEQRGGALRERAMDAERRIDAAARETVELIDSAEQRIAAMRQQVEATLEPRLRALGEAIDVAKGLIRDGGDLREALDRAERAKGGVLHAAKQLEAIRAQIDEATRSASRTVLDAAEQVDSLEHKREELMRSLREALDLCDIANTRLRETTEIAKAGRQEPAPKPARTDKKAATPRPATKKKP